MGRFLANTNELRRSALHYLKHGHYIDAPDGTRAYDEFWEEELKRITHGYSVGDLRITGNHYFYLNYCQILRVADMAELSGGRGVNKIESFPAFWDGDYNYFWAMDIARKGIKEKAYKTLGLDIIIPTEHLTGGKHLVVLKARGKGYSYKGGATLGKGFNTGRRYKGFAAAFEKEYLIKDGLLTKTWDVISFVDKNTAFRQPRLKDTLMHKRSGYNRNIGGTDIEMGTLNEIMGISLKDDPDKIRGKRGDVIMFEEAGKFPGLLKAWEVARPSVEQGALTTGILIAFGTGGTKDANYEALEELFYNPEAYNVLPMMNIWDDGAEDTICSFFTGANQNWEGYIDKDGNSDLVGAKIYHDLQRELKKKSNNPNALTQYTCEHPFTPREATLQSMANLFPTIELRRQLDSVIVHKRYQAGTPGIIIQKGEDWRFEPNEDVKPIWDFPLKQGRDTTGGIVVWETPYRSSNGKVPQGMYAIGHDPYAHDESVGGSLGASYVIKRTNNFSKTLNECLVASYIGRPSTQDEYNKNVFNLSRYYGCKIGFENDRGDMIGYAKRFKLLHCLEEEFELLDKRELQSARVNRPYGMHMTAARKQQGELYIRDWLNEVISVDDEGNTRLRLETILDQGLLEELLRFNQTGNFDRVMALMVTMYYMKELHNAEVLPREAPTHEEFFNRSLYQ